MGLKLARVRDSPTTTVRSPTKTQANNQSIHVEELAQTHLGSVVATPVSETFFVDILGCFSDYLELMAPTVLAPLP